jgi:hypothetical protein
MLAGSESLPQHAGAVEHLAWNETTPRLVSADSKGLVVVWKLDAQHGSWDTDSPAAWRSMLTNRRKSRVCSLAWSADGEQLCIVYAEGCVYSYHISGQELWVKDKLEFPLSFAVWSPLMAERGTASQEKLKLQKKPEEKEEDQDDDDDDDEPAAQGNDGGTNSQPQRNRNFKKQTGLTRDDPEVLMERPRTLAKKGQINQAIDAYLPLSVTDDKQAINHDILEVVWKEVMTLAQSESPKRFPGVAATVAHQMIGVRRYAEAAQILQMIGDHREAVEAFIAGKMFDEAKQTAYDSRDPKLIELAERANAMKEAGEDPAGKLNYRNDRFVLLATMEGEVHIIDAAGTYVKKLPLHIVESRKQAAEPASDDGSKKKAKKGEDTTTIIGIAWHDRYLVGVADPNQPVLAIGLDNGKFQLMRTLEDDEPQLFDVGMKTTCFAWNESAQFLLVAGQISGNGVLFLRSSYGHALQRISLGGSVPVSVSWERGSMHIASASESCVTFTGVRLDYKYSFFGSTLAVAYKQTAEPEQTVLFLDTRTHTRDRRLPHTLQARQELSETRYALSHPLFFLALNDPRPCSVHLTCVSLSCGCRCATCWTSPPITRLATPSSHVVPPTTRPRRRVRCSGSRHCCSMLIMVK